MSITRTFNIEIDEGDLAQEFCEGLASQQAEVLDRIAGRFDEWGPYSRDRQLLEIATRIAGTRGGDWVRRLVEFMVSESPSTTPEKP